MIDAVLAQTLAKDVVKHRQDELLEKKQRLESELTEAKEKLDSLPNLSEVQARAEAI